MSDELQREVALALKREPWLNAEECTIWSIWGDYPGNTGTFHDCLAIVLPRFATGGATLFQLLPPLSDVVLPTQIKRGIEYELVALNRDNERSAPVLSAGKAE